MTQPSNWNWNAGPVPPGPAVVVDIDGVLADAAGRQRFLVGPRDEWDWQGFFDAAGEDPVIEEMHVLLGQLDPALTVVLVTARPERIHAITEEWLRRTGIRWDLLVMRGYGSDDLSREYKAETVTQLRDHGFELRLAFEDDRANVDMFRAAGVPCVYFHSGYYDRPE